MLSENNKLLFWGWLDVGRFLCNTGGESLRCEDVLKHTRKLFPFPILATAPHTLRKCFKSAKCGDLCFEFRDRTRSRRLIDNPLFSFARLVVWRVLQFIESFLIQFGH